MLVPCAAPARPGSPGVSLMFLAVMLSLSCTTVHATGMVPESDAAGAAGPANPRAAQVDAWLAEWDRPGSPGVAVLVTRGEEILYRGTVGSANLEYRVPITSATLFQSASVSKQITAFAIAMLAQQHRISLDDEVRKYIPELADFGAPMTIRHLVYHTSGLRDSWELLFFAGWRREDVVTHEHVLDLALHQKTLNFPPGEQYLYTNTGYTLLAEIVQRVTGRPFASWVKENIFEPLEMHDTRIRDSLGELIEGRAHSYHARGDGGYENAPSNSVVLGGSNVFTTVDDLAKWARNLDEGTLGGDALARQVQTPGVLNDGTATHYAFGMFVGAERGVRMVAHGGGVAGYRSFLLRAPEHRLAVVVLANSSTCSAGGLANRIATLYLGEQMSPEPDSDSEEQADPATIEDGDWSKYAGTYLLSPGLTVTLRQRDGGWTVQATGEDEVEMRPVAAGRFSVDADTIPVRFGPAADGSVSMSYGGSTGTRVVAFSPTPSQLAAFAGEYHSEELRTTYTFVVLDNTLTLRHPRLGDIPIHPTIADQFGEDMADEFGIAGRWFRSFDFVRDQGGRITGLSVTAGGARNVRFDRL